MLCMGYTSSLITVIHHFFLRKTAETTAPLLLVKRMPNVVKGKKVKISLLQAMEAHRVVRG
jgi:hypothetical protein